MKAEQTPRWIFAPFLVTWALVLVLAGLKALDQAWPPPLERLAVRTVVVNDRNGRLLRAFAGPDGRWRLPVKTGDVDPRFVKMLLAYEDKRFYHHPGIDPLAMTRAFGQMIWHRRIVSGGSTLTMQVARLLDGPAPRSLTTKLRQMARALQLEWRLSKRQILAAYLNIAPYGGNLEGIRAASLAYFGKEPRGLSVGEVALLVALPQSPETRRPDRQRKAAQMARDRVLARMVGEGVLSQADASRASRFKVSGRRRPLPAFAAHASDEVRRAHPQKRVHRLTIERELQGRLETLAREQVMRFGRKVSVAMMVADHKSGDILALVGSPDFFDRGRQGAIDMTSARRSPGSALKPFIYGLAFEDGIVHPASLIEDTPHNFSGYRPRNFGLDYQGTVTVRRALQLSLNIPAIRLLESVGPQKLLARFSRSGVMPKLPYGKPAGLAIGLGGLGISMRDLVQLYTGLARRGRAVALRLEADGGRPGTRMQPMFGPVASWYVENILTGLSRPPGTGTSGDVAWKTGTSYGYRDAWAVGFDGAHVVAVWVGRPDGAPVPGITGASAAGPILFEAFQRIGETRVPFRPKPPGVLDLTTAQLPKALYRFVARGQLVRAGAAALPPPVIVYPPPGAHVDLGLRGGDEAMPLFLKIEGGVAPFRWLANGAPFAATSRRRKVTWRPDSPGFSTLTVLDAKGRPARVQVFVE